MLEISNEGILYVEVLQNSELSKLKTWSKQTFEFYRQKMLYHFLHSSFQFSSTLHKVPLKETS